MKTRSGKTYTISSCPVPLENNEPKVEENMVNRRPLGFIQPCQLSNELAKFLGKPVGTRLLRTDVARLINTYIRINNLQDTQNGRVINPDSKLRKLLNLSKNDELTYFNINKYMKPHFLKL